MTVYIMENKDNRTQIWFILFRTQFVFVTIALLEDLSIMYTNWVFLERMMRVCINSLFNLKIILQKHQGDRHLPHLQC